jgi:hypothetical protein
MCVIWLSRSAHKPRLEVWQESVLLYKSRETKQTTIVLLFSCQDNHGRDIMAFAAGFNLAEGLDLLALCSIVEGSTELPQPPGWTKLFPAYQPIAPTGGA